jgi:hypothetical protein
LGNPHAVEIRIPPKDVWRICVITVLMTAAIWPLQSNTRRGRNSKAKHPHGFQIDNQLEPGGCDPIYYVD